MAKKPKRRPEILMPKHPPDSFTRSDLLKALKKVAAAQQGRKKPPVSDGSK